MIRPTLAGVDEAVAAASLALSAPLPAPHQDEIETLAGMALESDAPGCVFPPTMSSVKTAEAILRQVAARGLEWPLMSPITEGGVVLEWENTISVCVPNDGPPKIGHACDGGDFDRSVCPEPCNAMHTYCTVCGKRQDGCGHYPNGELPQQPDGISDDSRGLPDVAAAAKRVRAYIEVSGDGLYEVLAGKPLYARDLEALVRHATGDRS